MTNTAPVAILAAWVLLASTVPVAASVEFKRYSVFIELDHKVPSGVRCSPADERLMAQSIGEALHEHFSHWTFEAGSKADRFLIKAEFRDTSDTSLRLVWRTDPESDVTVFEDSVDLSAHSPPDPEACEAVPARLKSGLIKDLKENATRKNQWRLFRFFSGFPSNLMA